VTLKLVEMAVKWNNLWHDGCRMWCRICLPFQSTWFHLWFSWFMLSCYLCLLILCNCDVFWIWFERMVSLYFVVILRPSMRKKKEGCKLVINAVLFQWSLNLKIYKRGNDLFKNLQLTRTMTGQQGPRIQVDGSHRWE